MVKQDFDLPDSLKDIPRNPDGFEDVEHFFQATGL